MITVPSVEVPALLYKYYPPERVDVVERQSLRFSSPFEFNDQFDSYHRLPWAADQKVKSSRHKLRRIVGILCLAESPDNHMMWVNYTKNHSGFVLGLDASSEFFQADDRSLRKVIYQPKPPVFKEPDENGCFYKSAEWTYEQEWRCVRQFTTTESRDVAFDWPLLRTVIFGSQMDQWVLARLVQMVTAYAQAYGGAQPQFQKSVPTPSDWRFKNVLDPVVMCGHCQGEGVVRS
jgi:hypothetical protein